MQTDQRFKKKTGACQVASPGFKYQIAEQNNRKARALELLLNKSITGDEYQQIKKQSESTIITFISTRDAPKNQFISSRAF